MRCSVQVTEKACKVQFIPPGAINTIANYIAVL